MNFKIPNDKTQITNKYQITIVQTKAETRENRSLTSVSDLSTDFWSLFEFCFLSFELFLYMGKYIRTTAPPFVPFSALIIPPCFSIIVRLTANPKPVPDVFVV